MLMARKEGRHGTIKKHPSRNSRASRIDTNSLRHPRGCAVLAGMPQGSLQAQTAWRRPRSSKRWPLHRCGRSVPSRKPWQECSTETHFRLAFGAKGGEKTAGGICVALQNPPGACRADLLRHRSAHGSFGAPAARSFHLQPGACLWGNGAACARRDGNAFGQLVV